MTDTLTVSELQHRWETILTATGRAVAGHPELYARLKAQIGTVIKQPVDINDYLPTARTLAGTLEALDPEGTGSIFQLFKDRITPKDIWQVRWLRMECQDLLAHLDSFDRWRRECRGLRVVK